MKILAKTKIIKVLGGELYFRKVQLICGKIGWDIMRKDTSALLKSDWDATFSLTSAFSEEGPAIPSCETAARPIPAGWATDLLSPFAKLEYAAGHQPVPEFRF